MVFKKEKKDGGKKVWIVIKYVCNEIKVCKVFDFQWSNGAREKGYDETKNNVAFGVQRLGFYYYFQDILTILLLLCLFLV